MKGYLNPEPDAAVRALAGWYDTGDICTIDADKGERLVAVANEPRLTLEAVRAVLREKGLPNLAQPRELKLVPQIPKLGTGKTDHRALEKLL